MVDILDCYDLGQYKQYLDIISAVPKSYIIIRDQTESNRTSSFVKTEFLSQIGEIYGYIHTIDGYYRSFDLFGRLLSPNSDKGDYFYYSYSYDEHPYEADVFYIDVILSKNYIKSTNFRIVSDNLILFKNRKIV
jgi:hypothetical protein